MISPYMGGSEVYVQNVAGKLVEMGHEVTWIGMRLPDTKQVEINDDGVILRRINVPFREKYMQSRRLFCFMPQLFKVIKDADVIQWNSFVAGITGGLISKLSHKPHILLNHEMFGELWQHFSDNRLEQIVYPMMEKVIVKNNYNAGICPCEHTKKSLIDLGMNPEKIKVIYHGIDHDNFKPSYTSFKEEYDLWDRFVFGYAGRLGFEGTCYSKNLKCLFDTFKKVKSEVPESVLLIAGTGWDNVKYYPKKLGLEIGKDVIPIGRLSYEKMPELYSSMDVFVSSSDQEGFGFTVCEAMACGVPVVAFKNSGSLDEVIDSGKSGIHVSPRTSNALAKAVVELHKDEKLRKKMGRYAMKWVQQYNWDKSAKEHEKVYEDVYCWYKINRW